MMVLVLFLIFINGAFLSLKIKKDLNFLEALGLSFPMGLGLWSVQLFLLDLLGIDLSQKGWILSVTILVCVVLFALIYKNLITIIQGFRDNIILSFKSVFKYFKNPFTINVLYVILFFLSLIIVFTILAKTLYWPIFNYDSIDGYDLLAKVIACEGTYNNSVFSEENPLFTVRSFYPPLLVHALTIGYIFGGGHSKIIAVIFLLSTITILYALVKDKFSHIQAMLAVFLLCIVPEFMGQSALTASNPVSACYVLICIGYFHRYLWNSDSKTLLLSLFALSFTIWTRTEAVIFAVPLLLLFIKNMRKNNTTKQIVLLSLFTAIPFVVWQVFIKYLNVSYNQPIIKRLYFDYEKFLNLLIQVKFVLFNKEFYALFFFLLIIVALSNIVYYRRSKITHDIGFVMITSFVLYVWIYYQIDTDYKTISQGSWIGSGFKRGLFYFIPIGCYYIAISFLTEKLLTSK